MSTHVRSSTYAATVLTETTNLPCRSFTTRSYFTYMIIITHVTVFGAVDQRVDIITLTN